MKTGITHSDSIATTVGPRLVQRLVRKPKSLEGSQETSGIDAFFRCDYMGSAEFEFGALPKTVHAMREHMKTVTDDAQPVPLVFAGADGSVVQFWYVGPKEHAAYATMFAMHEAGVPVSNYRSNPQEGTYIKRSLEAKDVAEGQRGCGCMDGWICLRADHHRDDIEGRPTCWALFLHKDGAEAFLRGLLLKYF
jgi:hypothetical protein